MNRVERQGWRTTDQSDDSNSQPLVSLEEEREPEFGDSGDLGGDGSTPASPVGDAVDPGRVIVTAGSFPGAFHVYHRNIPELQADGPTPQDAASILAQDMAREIESISDHYHRGLFGSVLNDVRAFVERCP